MVYLQRDYERAILGPTLLMISSTGVRAAKMQAIGEGEGHNQDPVPAWVARIERLGLGEWVPLMVEVLRPFSFIGAQAMHVLSPVLRNSASSMQIEQLTALLESPEALDRLSDAFSSPKQSEQPEP